MLANKMLKEVREMPKITFYNLPDEKKQKIITSAKKEFSRVPLEQASIKNIVESSGIARGSFYQYFESKEDLFDYVFEEIGAFKKFLKIKLDVSKIDIFDLNASIYHYLLEKFYTKENVDFARELVKNLKVTDRDFMRFHKCSENLPPPLNSQEYFQKIDTDNLKIQSEKDLQHLNKILFLVTRNMLATSFEYESREEAEKEYTSILTLLKQAFKKEKGEI